MLKLGRAIVIGFFITLMIGCVKQPAPRQEVEFTHRITYPGETLALISSWYTGSANNWQSVAAANPGLDPKRLRMGMIVSIPEHMVVRRDMLPRKLVASAPRRAPAAVENSEPEPESPSEQIAIDQAEEAASQATIEAAEELPTEPEAELAVVEESVEESAEEVSIPTESESIEEPAAVAEVSAPEVVADEIAEPAALEEVAEVEAPPAAAQPAQAAQTPGGAVKSRDELWKELLEE